LTSILAAWPMVDCRESTSLPAWRITIDREQHAVWIEVDGSRVSGTYQGATLA